MLNYEDRKFFTIFSYLIKSCNIAFILNFALTATHFFHALAWGPYVNTYVHTINSYTCYRVHNCVHKLSCLNYLRVQKPDTEVLILNWNKNLVAPRLFLYL